MGIFEVQFFQAGTPQMFYNRV